MVSYPKEFPGIVGRLRYCINRNASCRNKVCFVCVCDEDFVYYEDRDICDRPPVTIPTTRVTTSKSTVTTTLKLKETTTASASLPTSTSSKSAVSSSSKPKTGFTSTVNSGSASRLSSSPANTSTSTLTTRVTTSEATPSTTLKATTDKSSTSFSTSTSNTRTASTATVSTKAKDTTTTEKVSSSSISTTRKSTVYMSSKPTTGFTTKDGSSPASSFSSSSADTSSTKTANVPATSVGSSSAAAKPAAATTVPPGSKDRISTGSASNTGLIVGICVGLLVIIICALVLLYLKRKNKCHKRIKKFSKDPCQMDLKDQSRTSTVESPTSPGYDYAYFESQVGAGPISSKPHGQGMGNPIYGNKLRISNPFQNESDTDAMPFEQPVYQELDAEQVYADPDLTKVVDGGHQVEPVYRVVDEGPQDAEALSSPIYRELDDAPIYAETVPDPPEGDATYQTQYQALNYASNDNVYQPLADDWESRKYAK